MSVAILSPRARRDLLAAVRWIARDNPAGADALLEAVTKAGEHIGTYPHVGNIRPQLGREALSLCDADRLSDVIVYDAERRPPLIVRISHGARDLPHVLRKL